MITHYGENCLLTPRQLVVLNLLAKGYSNDEISKIMFITKHTVKAHICAIFEALETSSRVQAVVIGIKLGLLNVNDI